MVILQHLHLHTLIVFEWYLEEGIHKYVTQMLADLSWHCQKPILHPWVMLWIGHIQIKLVVMILQSGALTSSKWADHKPQKHCLFYVRIRTRLSATIVCLFSFERHLGQMLCVHHDFSCLLIRVVTKSFPSTPLFSYLVPIKPTALVEFTLILNNLC